MKRIILIALLTISICYGYDTGMIVDYSGNLLNIADSSASVMQWRELEKTNGTAWFVNYADSLTTDSIRYYSIKTPSSAYYLIDLDIKSSKLFEVAIFEGCTVTAVADTSTIRSYNRNKTNNSALVIQYNPALSDSGTAIDRYRKGSDYTYTCILKASTNYCIRVKSNEAGAVIRTRLDFYLKD